jgi:hypothetical protein
MVLIERLTACQIHWRAIAEEISQPHPSQPEMPWE